MTAAPVLLADVGGTNTRFALSRDGALDVSSIQRVPNASVASFEIAARAYLEASDVAPETLCVAIAGPVMGRVGQLTNGAKWRFDPQALKRDLGLQGAHVINDLAALGYALPVLPDTAVHALKEGDAGNGQSLVVGVATGFNVSIAGRHQVFQAELGHASVPERVAEVLQEGLGGTLHGMETVEQCFSGLGLAQLHLHRTGHALDPAEITASQDSDAQETVQLFARGLGAMCREMMYQYLPLGGLYFNGSMARAVLTPNVIPLVLAEAGRDDVFLSRFGQIGLNLITEDAAGLYGCARFANMTGS